MRSPSQQLFLRAAHLGSNDCARLSPKTFESIYERFLTQVNPLTGEGWRTRLLWGLRLQRLERSLSLSLILVEINNYSQVVSVLPFLVESVNPWVWGKHDSRPARFGPRLYDAKGHREMRGNRVGFLVTLVDRVPMGVGLTKLRP